MATNLSPREKAADLVARTTDFSGLRLESIHSMDHIGEIQGRIVWREHVMEIDNYHYDCGVIGEAVRCSCGFRSDFYSGYGCWQLGHDGPPEDHNFDFKHGAIYDAAAKYAETNLSL